MALIRAKDTPDLDYLMGPSAVVGEIAINTEASAVIRARKDPRLRRGGFPAISGNHGHPTSQAAAFRTLFDDIDMGDL